MQDIKEIRKQLNMSQKEFATYFGINYRTLQGWELGRSKVPPYVITLIQRVVSLEGNRNE